ncbi:MAG: hypothetical protein KatS3mg002_0314 [Candidatus Woesearchaeota archaeon]|nr:MAG: hypothetical protein KatS3mg002_0314 [Candidatus Woesearchaeota archaeon]
MIKKGFVFKFPWGFTCQVEDVIYKKEPIEIDTLYLKILDGPYAGYPIVLKIIAREWDEVPKKTYRVKVKIIEGVGKGIERWINVKSLFGKVWE